MLAKQLKNKRQVVNKLLKELKGFGVEIEIDYPTCEVLGLKCMNPPPCNALISKAAPKNMVSKARFRP